MSFKKTKTYRSDFDELKKSISECTHCRQHLPYPPRPIVQLHPNAKILVIGQAPGQKAHDSAIPWNDASGNNLRKWMGIEKEIFYDKNKIALMPMGFCYPGKNKSGDLPPRPECAELWHQKILQQLSSVKLTLLIGMYAQKHYLGQNAYNTLTENVHHFNDFLPKYFPLVHPSPRNGIWLSKNTWFEKTAIPVLQKIIRTLIES